MGRCEAERHACGAVSCRQESNKHRQVLEKYQRELMEISQRIQEEQHLRQELQVELMMRHREIDGLRQMMQVRSANGSSLDLLDPQGLVAPGVCCVCVCTHVSTL